MPQSVYISLPLTREAETPYGNARFVIRVRLLGAGNMALSRCDSKGENP